MAMTQESPWRWSKHSWTPSSSCTASPTPTAPLAFWQTAFCSKYLASRWSAVWQWSRKDCAPWSHLLRFAQSAQWVDSLCLALPARKPALINIPVLSLCRLLWTPLLGCLRSPYFYRILCQLLRQPWRQPELHPQLWHPVEPSMGVYQRATTKETRALTKACKRKQNRIERSPNPNCITDRVLSFFN